MSQFSQELLKLDSSILVIICIMNDHIMGLRPRVMVLTMGLLADFG